MAALPGRRRLLACHNSALADQLQTAGSGTTCDETSLSDAGRSVPRWETLADSTILYGLSARAALLRGADQMAGLVAPTLGPVARTVAIAPILGSAPPEVLDTAETIARRTIELADPFENAGAMMVRDLILRVAESVG